MKFLGKMVDVSCIKQFTSAVNTVGRITKECLLRLSQAEVCLVLSSEVGGVRGAPALWLQVDPGHLFHVYNMEGVSPSHNHIYMLLQPDKLAKTLSSFRSGQSAARSVKMKLTKKHSACLTLEMELSSVAAHSRTVVHDIPVVLVPRRQWHLYQEPVLPQPEACLYLPPLKQLRNVLERLKSLSTHLRLEVGPCSRLTLSVSTDDVRVSTHFLHLTRPLGLPVWDQAGEGSAWPEVLSASEQARDQPGAAGQARDQPGAAERTRDQPGAAGQPRNKPGQQIKDQPHSVTVDVRKLLLFLGSDFLGPAKIVCNVVAGRLLHLYVVVDDITLHYFLPVSQSS